MGMTKTMGKKKKLKRKIEVLKGEKKIADDFSTFMEGRCEAYRIENEVLKERIKQLEGVKPCPFCGEKLTARKALYPEGGIDAYAHPENGCILAYDTELIIMESDIELWNKRAGCEE